MVANNSNSNKIKINPVEKTSTPHYELELTAQNLPPKPKIKKSQTPNFIKKENKFSSFFWSNLEWLSMAAIIFIVFFFFLNFEAYFELFKLKISQINESNQTSDTSPTQLKPVSQNQISSLPGIEAPKINLPPLVLSITPPDSRIVVPRINKNVPIVSISTESLLKKDWTALENQIQLALRDGVVHYPNTAYPGQNNNVVITGHSSYFPWDPGRFKDVFALLHQVVEGDEIIVYHNQKAFKYRVTEKFVVKPNQVEVLTQNGEDKLTLITCTPVGTNLNRLIVIAKPE